MVIHVSTCFYRALYRLQRDSLSESLPDSLPVPKHSAAVCLGPVVPRPLPILPAVPRAEPFIFLKDSQDFREDLHPETKETAGFVRRNLYLPNDFKDCVIIDTRNLNIQGVSAKGLSQEMLFLLSEDLIDREKEQMIFARFGMIFTRFGRMFTDSNPFLMTATWKSFQIAGFSVPAGSG